MGEKRISVIIADDHDMVRRGLRAFLGARGDFDLLGEARDGGEALDLAREHRPDVVLMDLVMEGIGGVEATGKILEFHPDCRVIILTSYYDDRHVVPALEAGAVGYLLKTSRGEEIAAAIRRAVDGESVIDPRAATAMLSGIRHGGGARHDELTPREMQILVLIGHGRTNGEIADDLGIGVRTVKTHVSNLLGKLDLADRTQAAVYAHRQGIVKDRQGADHTNGPRDTSH